VSELLERLYRDEILPIWQRANAAGFAPGNHLQCFYQVLRLCLLPRATHLMRCVHPESSAGHLSQLTRLVDELIFDTCSGSVNDSLADAWASDDPITAASTEATVQRLHLPTLLGGAGLSALSAIAPAAYLGSWYLTGHAVARLAPRFFHIHSHTGPTPEMMPLKRLLGEAHVISLFQPDDQPTLWDSFTRKPRSKMQAVLSSMIHTQNFKRIKELMAAGAGGPGAAAVWESGGGGDAVATRWLSVVPVNPVQRIGNSAFRLALAAHIGVRLEQISPTLFKDAAGGAVTSCRACGATGVACWELHAVRCAKGGRPLQIPRHNAIRDAIRFFLQSRASVSIETPLRQYFSPADGKEPSEVNHRADVSVHRADQITTLVDVVVSCPKEGFHGDKGGEAAKLAEQTKRDHYHKFYKLGRATLVPFAVEAFGRWGKAAWKAAQDWASHGCSEPYHKDPAYSRAIDDIRSTISCITARHLGTFWDRFLMEFSAGVGVGPLPPLAMDDADDA